MCIYIFIFGRIIERSACTDSSKLVTEVSIDISGFSGASKGVDTPVKFLISPFLALAYNPFTSLFSQASMGVLTYTSKKSSFPMMDAAI